MLLSSIAGNLNGAMTCAILNYRKTYNFHSRQDSDILRDATLCSERREIRVLANYRALWQL